MFSHLVMMKKQEQTMFQRIRCFAEWIGAVKDIEILGDNSIIDNIFLVQRLSNIKAKRYHYAKVLQEAELVEEAQSMRNITVMWENVCLLLIKAIVTRRTTLCRKMKDCIFDIADKEELLFNKIYNLVDDYRNERSEGKNEFINTVSRN